MLDAFFRTPLILASEFVRTQQTVVYLANRLNLSIQVDWLMKSF